MLFADGAESVERSLARRHCSTVWPIPSRLTQMSEVSGAGRGQHLTPFLRGSAALSFLSYLCRVRPLGRLVIQYTGLPQFCLSQ